MHGLTDGVVTAEGEGDIAHTPRYSSVGKVPLDPLRCAYIVDSVVIVGLDSGRHRKDIGIENNVLRLKTDGFDQNVIEAEPIQQLDNRRGVGGKTAA